MEVGDVRPATQADFDHLLSMAEEEGTSGGQAGSWTVAVQKSHMTIWTKTNSVSSFKMIKVRSAFQGVAASVAYDVLHDASYRKHWDKNMMAGKELCVLDECNDIGYYSVRTPPPLKNRDFVTQRSWSHSGSKFMIMNHSVYHKAAPPSKNFIRGTSFFTGYVIEPTGPKSCTLTYITQADPRGNIPSWLVNKLITIVTPKIVDRLLKACSKYEKWKESNDPSHKPWLYPDQVTAPFIDYNDVTPGAAQTTGDDQTEEGETAGLKEEEFCDDHLEGLSRNDSSDILAKSTEGNGQL